MNAAFITAAYNPENQDRGAIIRSEARLILVVADGAGGQSGGKEAASIAVELVREAAAELSDANACANLLQNMDFAIHRDTVAGETTCSLAVVTEAWIFGASVGDSGAWVINASGVINLTARQSRKPFIGSGSAYVSPFQHKRTGNEFLLLATDGLLKYTSSERIISVCKNIEPAGVPKELVGLVRYPSGALPDDVTVIFAYE